MGFNCAQEKAKFGREWLRLRKEYTDAGMSEAAIQKIYEYDWYCFCRNRAYRCPQVHLDLSNTLAQKNEKQVASYGNAAGSLEIVFESEIDDVK